MRSTTISPTQLKVHENRLRRMAARQGLQLVKSRRRDPRAYDYGTYLLTDPKTNTLTHGERGLGLEDIERILRSGYPVRSRVRRAAPAPRLGWRSDREGY